MSTTTRLLARGTALIAAAALLAGCEPPPNPSVQRGYRGTGMVHVAHPANQRATDAVNAPPADSTAVAAPADGPKASETYKNVKVLGDLSVAQFTATMVDMTNWVAPKQGCVYCHTANFEEDTLYTKVVARRMLQMTQHINADWKAHVGNTGVTCYTCHRGNPVPANLWTQSPETQRLIGLLGNKDGQNAPAATPALASLPNDVFQHFLQGAGDPIRVQSDAALPAGNKTSVKDTEWTYGLMMHMSKSLGVNCTYCHNSRSWQSWEQSSPPRVNAWHGIRMARDLNNEYLTPLQSTFPAERLGPLGDAPKLNCATCHQGAYKPLYGADILKNHPGMTGIKAQVKTTSSDGVKQDFYFAVGSAALPADATRQVEALATALKGTPEATVTLSGLHLAAGPLAVEGDLAAQRAASVREALLAAGVAAQKIVMEEKTGG